MSYGEACRLTQILADDPSSRVAVAVREYDHPWTHEFAALASLYDLTQYANTDPKHHQRIKHYPRPWRDPNRRGRTKLSREEVIAVLNAHGHKIGG